MFVAENMFGRKQPANAKMRLGSAVEHGVNLAINEGAPLADCIKAVEEQYDLNTALMGDPARENVRKGIPGMVEGALTELMPYVKAYGVPLMQGAIEWQPDGLKYPIFGYYDYHWPEQNLTIDLKTTGTMPGEVKWSHALQVAFYARGDNGHGSICYVTPKKHAVYAVENIAAHRAAMHKTALACERWLSQSDDPQWFVDTTAPDYEQFYWNGPARQIGFDLWKF